jgi:hypothetical protein
MLGGAKSDASLADSGAKFGGKVFELGFDIYDYFETKKEMRRLEQARKDEARRMERRDDARYDQQREDSRRADAYTIAATQEQQNYNRAQSRLTHMLGAIAKKPDIEQRFSSLWPRRR